MSDTIVFDGEMSLEIPIDGEVGMFTGVKGDTGATPVITVTASIGANTGTPTVSVTKTGTDEAPVLALAFDGLKGETGEKGADGKDGKDGVDGKDGADGYTPVKGVDYFDGQDGADGVVDYSVVGSIVQQVIGDAVAATITQDGTTKIVVIS